VTEPGPEPVAAANNFPANGRVIAVFPEANEEGHCLQRPKNIHPVQSKDPWHSPSMHLDMQWCCAVFPRAAYGANL